MHEVLSARIRALREEKGWTQSELGLYSGVTQAHISRLEAGKTSGVSGIVLAKLADVFDTTIDYLMGRINDPSPYPSSDSANLLDSHLQHVLKDYLKEQIELLRKYSSRIGMRLTGEEIINEQRRMLRPIYPTLEEEIAELVEEYPDLGPLFDQARAELPEHAVQALVMNVKIWAAEATTRKDFIELHDRLNDFLGEGR